MSSRAISTLFINNTKIEDAGTYECRKQNLSDPSSVDTYRINLIVLETIKNISSKLIITL